MITKTKKGFSFLELLIAMGIFSIIMLAVMDAFTGVFSAYNKSRNLNRSLQNAQQAMNLVTKSIRTSSVLKCDGSDCSVGDQARSIRIYDYSQKKCIEYQFYSGGTGNILRYREDSNASDKISCQSASFLSSSYKNLIIDGISDMKFNVTPSTEDGVVGKVTVLMQVTSGSGNQADIVNIQSTLSLRDYLESNL